jgi:pimeloyl-ACP methyl ester carboxylesterase
VFAALADAGVGPHVPVLLVGHSEGGIVAVNAARDAAASGRFRVTHVVTAGSPVGTIAADVPSGVQVLALENTADVVPGLDGVPNPDLTNVTTVRTSEEHGSIGANHDLQLSYEPAAVAAQTAGNGSIDAFLHSARGFLSADTMTTHAYQITRSP